MTAEELLDSLFQRDVIVMLNGDQLQVDAPRGILNKELRNILNEHKPEILRYLHRRSHDNAVALPGSGDTDAESIAAMPLNIFAKAGLVVQVWSEYLGCEVLFVSDNVPATAVDGTGLSVYRAQELKKLARVPPDPKCLRNIQMVKEIIGGTIQDVREKDSSTTQDGQEKDRRAPSTKICVGDSARG